jgi:hypothetical protein
MTTMRSRTTRVSVSIFFCMCNDLHLTKFMNTYRAYGIAGLRSHMRNSYQHWSYLT